VLVFDGSFQTTELKAMRKRQKRKGEKKKEKKKKLRAGSEEYS